MWLIPGKTKIKIEVFKGVGIADILIGIVLAGLLVVLFISNLPGEYIIMAVIAILGIALLARVDDEPNYVFFLHILRHFGFVKHYIRAKDDKQLLAEVEVGEKEAALEALFETEEEEAAARGVTKKERKEQKKAEKKLYKEESKRLKTKGITKEEEDEIWKARAARSAERAKQKRNHADATANWANVDDIVSFTGIKDGFIEFGGQYYGTVLEITPVEFRFFSQMRRNTSINVGIGRILRSLNPDYGVNIVKIDRPIHYDQYIKAEQDKLEVLRSAYEKGMMREDELQARVEVVYNRLEEIENLVDREKVIIPFYYLVLFNLDKNQLEIQTSNAIANLEQAEIPAERLWDRDLALFLKYSNTLDVDENELDYIDEENYANWAKPQQIDFRIRTTEVNHVITHTMRVNGYMSEADDAWMASVMSMSATKCVLKIKTMDREKSVRTIDRSLQELRSQLNSTNIDSKIIELQTHIDSLSELLATLSGENETLLNMNFYVTAYDIVATENNPKIKEPKNSQLARISGMKKLIKRLYRENGLRLTNMDFEQTEAFIATQISDYDPFAKMGRGLPSNSISAGYPWIFANVSDIGGIKLGASDGIPVFIDFFRRDSERVNSNMVIVGKSGSGKSYATKSLITNLAADDSKIFILDPENEYAELAHNLHGQLINVGNAQYGRLNPFHIMTALDDDEQEEGTVSGSYATHLQFLEEFFRQIIPDCEKDAMEYLNSIIDRMYLEKGITAETNISALHPRDFPIFDDLYDGILAELQKSDNEYIRSMLRTLINYISKFSTGGRNANIWNGPSTITTEENFSVFNFQSLLSNRNASIANAQMLLVLKYIDNEIIKNKDYNAKNNMHRKVVVVIDEAHVFIDEKYPIALDFMFQMAKRIRKYNGMQIVITQNIKDFVGTEELARKSTAIINACQYSFIFPLAPNDMNDLCRLYEKAGGINENEQEQIVQAQRGQAFTILSPQSRSSFKVEVPKNTVDMFQEQEYVSEYFTEEPDDPNWVDYLGDSREIHEQVMLEKEMLRQNLNLQEEVRNFVHFSTVTEDEYEAEAETVTKTAPIREPEEEQEFDVTGLIDADDIPEDAAEFEAMLKKRELIAKPQTVTSQDVPTSSGAMPEMEQLCKAVQQMSENTALMVEQSHMEMMRMNERSQRRMEELIGQMSIDHLMSKIQLTIEAEVQKRMAELIAEQGLIANAAAVAGAAAVPTPFAEVAAPETPQMSETSSVLGNIFEAAAQMDETEEPEMPQAIPEVDDGFDGFDLMAFLAEEAKHYEDVSSIEKMEMYDEKVIDITIEDLAIYIRNIRTKQAN